MDGTGAPSASIACMSGALVLEHRRILQEICGPARFARALDRLPPDARREYDETSAVSWPRVTTAEHVMHAAAIELARDPVELHEQVSRTAVERTLTTLWRLLLRFTTDEALVARTPRIYARALNRGELVPLVVCPGRAEIRVVGWPDIPEFSTRGIRIAIESVLRLAGRDQVRVIAEPGAQGPIFHATWIP
ncbi:hypothetical protein [Sandaracinus amylolyticus]|nr:hypothetical protein [Sandaracinus amylolyticus]